MPNSFWYILLMILSIGLFIFTLYKKRDRSLVTLYFVVTGGSFIFEIIIFVLLDAYIYYPNIISIQYFDNVFGSLISQALAIPIVAVMIAAFRIKVRYIILLIALFYGIEQLFLKSDLFEHHWWRTPYTSVIIFIVFLFVQKWHYITKYKDSVRIYFLHTFSMVITLYNLLMYNLVLLFHTHLFTIGWFQDIYHDHITGNALYILLMCIPTTLVIMYFNKYTITALLLLDLINKYFLIHMHLLVLADYWHPIYYIILDFFALFLYRWFYKKFIRVDAYIYS